MLLKNNSLAKVFCFFCILGLIITPFSILASHGELWHRIFHYNLQDYAPYNDTGMDFFHSIEYLNGNDPYGIWKTLYPPLANLLFKVFFKFVPEVQKESWVIGFGPSVAMRCTASDLRTWMPTFMLFLGTVLLTTIFIFAMVLSAFKQHNKAGAVVAICSIFSYGYIYAIERGNIIILSMACALLFVLYHDSPSYVIREIALLALAVSANLKLYPALLGFILLYKKNWKEAGRVIIYGILLFILPCLSFTGGFSNIQIAINKIIGDVASTSISNSGTSFDKLCYSVLELFSHWLGWGIPQNMSVFFSVANKICLLFGIAFGFFLPCKWQKTLGIVLAFILFSNQGIYVTCFLTIPLVQFLTEEERISKRNIIPLLGFVLVIAFFPVFNKDGDTFSYTSFRLQIGLLILFIYELVECFRLILKKKKNFVYRRE